MTWLTDTIRTFILDNPGQTATWYAERIGCSRPTAKKVLLDLDGYKDKKRKPGSRGLTNEEKAVKQQWLDKVGIIVKTYERCADGWEDWFDWNDAFKKGLTPMQAYRTYGG